LITFSGVPRIIMIRRTLVSLSRTSSLSLAPGGETLVGGSGEGRVVVLGTGWGSFTLAKQLKDSPNVNKLRVVSPSNHFVFTPLLPSTAVGTLEFRCIQEPIRKVLGGNGKFVQAKAQTVDPVEKTIVFESIYKDETERPEKFMMKYDKLVIGVGVKTNTFGIESIKEGDGVHFLKHLYHARNIRNNIIESFEKASIPGTSEEERQRLLSFIIVGGGPTSCEFAAELHDFVTADAKRLYMHMVKYVKVTVVEAGPALLGPFDRNLQNYTHGLFKDRNIDVRLATAVSGIEDYIVDGFRFPARQAVLSDGTKLPFGTLVWSAGLSPVNFTKNCDLLPKSPNGRILVDEFLRVKGFEGEIWAIGDGAVNEKSPLPQLAQVARQQGLYLGDVLNGKQKEDEKPFTFFSLGSMASLGEMKGVYDGTSVGTPGQEIEVGKMTGFVALLMWRFAYWGKQQSTENMLAIPFHWMKSYLFGRDVSRF
jgi:NADH dehydrogenase FAD-containing subunit